MKDEMNYIDEIFRQNSHGFEREPSSAAWERLESMLEEKSTARPFIPIRLAAGLAALLVLTAGFFLFNQVFDRHFNGDRLYSKKEALEEHIPPVFKSIPGNGSGEEEAIQSEAILTEENPIEASDKNPNPDTAQDRTPAKEAAGMGTPDVQASVIPSPLDMDMDSEMPETQAQEDSESSFIANFDVPNELDSQYEGSPRFDARSARKSGKEYAPAGAQGNYQNESVTMDMTEAAGGRVSMIEDLQGNWSGMMKEQSSDSLASVISAEIRGEQLTLIVQDRLNNLSTLTFLLGEERGIVKGIQEQEGRSQSVRVWIRGIGNGRYELEYKSNGETLFRALFQRP